MSFKSKQVQLQKKVEETLELLAQVDEAKKASKQKYPQTKLSVPDKFGGDINYGDSIKKWKHLTRKKIKESDLTPRQKAQIARPKEKTPEELERHDIAQQHYSDVRAKKDAKKIAAKRRRAKNTLRWRSRRERGKRQTEGRTTGGDPEATAERVGKALSRYSSKELGKPSHPRHPAMKAARILKRLSTKKEKTPKTKKTTFRYITRSTPGMPHYNVRGGDVRKKDD